MGDSFSFTLLDLPEESQELNKASVVFGRRGPGTPKVGLGNFLRSHLQVMQRMAWLVAAKTDKKLKDVVI